MPNLLNKMVTLNDLRKKKKKTLSRELEEKSPSPEEAALKKETK